MRTHLTAYSVKVLINEARRKAMLARKVRKVLRSLPFGNSERASLCATHDSLLADSEKALSSARYIYDDYLEAKACA